MNGETYMTEDMCKAQIIQIKIAQAFSIYSLKLRLYPLLITVFV